MFYCGKNIVKIANKTQQSLKKYKMRHIEQDFKNV